MHRMLLAATCLSLGFAIASVVPHTRAQPGDALPRAWEYLCVDDLPGRENLQGLHALLNSKGAEGWRYVGRTPPEVDADGYCFERPR